MKPADHMLRALGDLLIADMAIKPGDFADVVSSSLHTAIFHLQVSLDEIDNPKTQLAQAEAIVNAS